MSPFGFRSFNRNWVNSRYSFATKTLIGCERGRVTNDMMSCTKRVASKTNQVCLQHSTVIPVHVGSADQSKPHCSRLDFDPFRFKKKVKNAYLPYFEEHNKVKYAYLPYFEEHTKLR